MTCFVIGPALPLRTSIPLKISKCPLRPPPFAIRACMQRAEDSTVPRTEPEPLPEPQETSAYIDEPAIEDGSLSKEEMDDDDDDDEPTEGVNAEADDDWYDVVERIGKADTKVTEAPPPSGVVDLAELDGLGREVLASASYHTVVDIDIEEGGELPDDDDNNDLFCGVGLDALVDTPELIENLRNDFGIETATHVQLAAVPRVAEGRDIVVQSHTGTGKTLAFLLPMLDELDAAVSKTQGIIIAPTRELAMQIFREVEKLVKGLNVKVMALIGGANPQRQVDKLRKQTPHVVVGTPGRLAEMHENRELRLYGASMMIVDEVDHCVGQAFAEDVAYLLHHCPRKVQKVLVSATSDVDAVRMFATKYLHRPVLLRVGAERKLPKQIEHWYCVVPARMRIELLRKLMNSDPPPTRAIAFVDAPRRADMVAERLFEMKIACGTLRGNAHKLERAEVLTAFRKGRIPLLITTEVAARGLDIPDVTHIFNIDLPTDGDHYVHRAGRCGRVRNAGTVVNFTTAETAFVAGRLEKELGVEITRMEPRGGKYVKVAGKGDMTEGAVPATRRTKHIKGPGEKVAAGVATPRTPIQGRGERRPPVAAPPRTSTQGRVERRSAVVASPKTSIQGREERKSDFVTASRTPTQERVERISAVVSSPMTPGRDESEQNGQGKLREKKKDKVVEDDKKVRIKKRARDLKNKGKPKGRVGRGASASEPSPSGEAVVVGKPVSRVENGAKGVKGVKGVKGAKPTKGAKGVKGVKGAKGAKSDSDEEEKGRQQRKTRGSRQPKNLDVKAREQRWVGNR